MIHSFKVILIYLKLGLDEAPQFILYLKQTILNNLASRPVLLLPDFLPIGSFLQTEGVNTELLAHRD